MRDSVRSAKFLDTLIEPARTRRIVRTLAGLVLFAACASAGAASLSGTYEGAGRDCRGLLQVQADFIAWHTPFANCAKSRYRVLDQSCSQNATRRVFQLKASTACSFAVITLEHDAAHPDYWNATGYRSQKDYRRGSDDAWLCNLTRRRQHSLRPSSKAGVLIGQPAEPWLSVIFCEVTHSCRPPWICKARRVAELTIHAKPSSV